MLDVGCINSVRCPTRESDAGHPALPACWVTAISARANVELMGVHLKVPIESVLPRSASGKVWGQRTNDSCEDTTMQFDLCR